jgi:hypothetical protein
MFFATKLRDLNFIESFREKKLQLTSISGPATLPYSKGTSIVGLNVLVDSSVNE